MVLCGHESEPFGYHLGTIQLIIFDVDQGAIVLTPAHLFFVCLVEEDVWRLCGA